MPRYKLTVEYDGTPFVGWQIQENGPSVQGELALAASRFCGEKVSVHGAGRTDAGVHALGQVCHVDMKKDWDTDTVRDALNAHLRPHPIAVIAVEKVEILLRCALFRRQAPLPLSHHQSSRRSHIRAGAGLAHPETAQQRSNARRRAASRRPA